MTNYRKENLKEKRYRFQWSNLITLILLVFVVSYFFITFNLIVIIAMILLGIALADGILTIREINKELNA